MNIIRRFYYSYKINSLANSLKKEASKKNKSDEKIQKIINNLDLFVNSQKMNYFFEILQMCRRLKINIWCFSLLFAIFVSKKCEKLS